jgi:hypothetical protein
MPEKTYMFERSEKTSKTTKLIDPQKQQHTPQSVYGFTKAVNSLSKIQS